MLIVDGIKAYGASLPTEIPTALFKSAVYAFGFNILLAKDIKGAQIASVVATLAALVDALTLPLFRYFLADNQGKIEWYQHATTVLVNLSIAQTLVDATTRIHGGMGFNVNLLSMCGVMILSDLYFYGFDTRGTQQARPYIYYHRITLG